jgi:hypothetical protein
MVVVAMRNGENADGKSWSGISTPVNAATESMIWKCIISCLGMRVVQITLRT